MAWLANILRQVLEFMFGISHHWWLAVVLFTVAVRILLLPLVTKQIRSQMAMQALQPEIEKIKKRFKGDPTRENQETMELFRKHKVNPMAGCLTLLVQMPVWWALYQMLQSKAVMEMFAASPTNRFLAWSLTQPDKYLIFPILAAASTFFMTQTMGVQQTEGTARIMNLMSPLLMLMISWRFPVALSLYFVVNNGLQILQQVLSPKPQAITGEAS
ncbi:MAG: YidC/Oxa1 family membrane protein insertase [Chloroflexota bacterium]